MKTVNFYDYQDELRKVNWEIYEMSKDGSDCWSSLGPLHNINSDMPGNTIALGINWCACGTVSLERAEIYAKELKKVLELAKNFKYNGYQIEL